MSDEKRQIAVFLDTNFLLLPTLFSVDIFQAIKDHVSQPVSFFVFDKIINELEGFASSSSEKGLAAKVALQLIRKESVSVLSTGDDKGYVDDQLLDCTKYVPDYDVAVATQDKELKKRLSERGIKRLVMSGKALVVFEK